MLPFIHCEIIIKIYNDHAKNPKCTIEMPVSGLGPGIIGFEIFR